MINIIGIYFSCRYYAYISFTWKGREIMKITKAIFENFICLESGLNKRRVEIDFSKCKNQIILFVGPMGSGKTTILSHLIPYSHVGTLDERNSNPIIIPEGTHI